MYQPRAKGLGLEIVYQSKVQGISIRRVSASIFGSGLKLYLGLFPPHREGSNSAPLMVCRIKMGFKIQPRGYTYSMHEIQRIVVQFLSSSLVSMLVVQQAKQSRHKVERVLLMHLGEKQVIDKRKIMAKVSRLCTQHVRCCALSINAIMIGMHWA